VADVNPYASRSLDVGPGPTNVRWQVFGLSCGASWILYLHRYVFALIKPALAQEWDVDLVSLGAMDSVFYASYLVCQVPSGLAADLVGSRLFLGSIIVAWSICLALHALAPGLKSMYVVRLLFGITQAGAYPTLSKVSRAWFPFSIRTSLQGWVASFFGRAGGASANVLFAAVMLGMIGMPWRTAVLILSTAGVALGAAVLVILRNTPAEHPRTNDAERRLIAAEPAVEIPASEIPPSSSGRLAPPAGEFWRSISARSARNMLYFLAQGFCATFADAVFVTWVPYFLREVHGLDYGRMGVYSALPLIGGACGGLAGGYLNDLLLRVVPSRRWARSLVGATGMGLACLLAFAALLVYANPYAFCLVLMLAKFFGDWSQPTVWGTVTDIAGSKTATVFGLVNGVGGIGALVAPVMLGAVATEYSWAIVFVVVAVTYAVGATCWLLVNCTVPLFAVPLVASPSSTEV